VKGVEEMASNRDEKHAGLKVVVFLTILATATLVSTELTSSQDLDEDLSFLKRATTLHSVQSAMH
jgi:hypothetical protein